MTTKEIPKKSDEFKYWVGYQLKLNRSSYAKVARKLGISRQAVADRINNPSERVAVAIAAELKAKKEQLWPERYAA